MVDVQPPDEHNEQLVANVHPADWKNPTPSGRYNLVVVGAGTAGLVSAIGAAGLGAKVALVERHLMGGDCLNVGCVPSKALIRAARAAHQVRTAGQFGVRSVNGEGASRGEGDLTADVDFAEVMQRMRKLRASISPVDSARRFTEAGVDVYLGDGTFTSGDTLEVAGQQLKFARAIIATGGRAAAPAIEGLEAAGYLTNETVFSLTQLPPRLAVIGGGPIGCELAQAFRRFGSEVHLIHRPENLLNKEERDAAALIESQFVREGIHIHTGSNTVKVEATGVGKLVTIERDEQQQTLEIDEILVAVGRRPNVEGLGLEAAGVKYRNRGVEVDDRLQTSNPRIFAAGDVCTKFQFTHAADAMARICLRNALFPFGREKMSSLVIPRTTYTDPEVASVGMVAHDMNASFFPHDSYRQDLSHVDRAILDGEDEGFAVVHTQKDTDKIVGATIVASHAGDMIGEITILMNKKLGLGTLGSVIHCYPTQVEVLKRIADAYARTKLTPTVAGLFKRWLKWQR